ncbi:unnamed protein product [Cylindrotheca closterium]|uniref:RRM domain-containing protein n=1 Tax=Cylindrotheca closterium TaxID=2856 RepID=A0AAD2FM97_9STRA|nr:unnamed protein product [Cylindrotheca closterium]
MSQGRNKRGRAHNSSRFKQGSGHFKSNHHNNHPKRQRRDEHFNRRGADDRQRFKSDPQYGAHKVKIEAQTYHHQVKGELKAEPKSEQALAKPIPDIDFPTKEKNDKACVFISNLSVGVSKEALARFIRHRYIELRIDEPEIVAISIREDRKDCFVEFKNQSHALDAKNALDGRSFGDFGTILRVFPTEKKAWTQYVTDAFTKEEEENKRKQEADRVKAEEIAPEVEDGEVKPKGELSSVQLDYFRNLQKDKEKVRKCLYLHALPQRLSPKELKNFIIEECEKLIHLTPKITACHVRSQENDACVELEAHTEAVMDAIKDRFIEGTSFGVMQWKKERSKRFITYYQEKEERKRQKKAPKDLREHQNQQDLDAPNDTGAATTDSSRSGSGNNNSANASALAEELKRQKEECRRIRKELIKVTKDHQVLNFQYRTVSEEKEQLAKQLNGAQEEVDTTQSELTELKEINSELKGTNTKQEDEISDLRKQLHQMQQAKMNADAEAAEMREKQEKQIHTIKNLEKDLYQTKQLLAKAREEKDDAMEALQGLRVQAHNQGVQVNQNIKKEWIESEKEKGELKRQNRRLQVYNAALESMKEEKDSEIGEVVKKEPVRKKPVKKE